MSNTQACRPSRGATDENRSSERRRSHRRRAVVTGIATVGIWMLIHSAARADRLDAIRQRGVLIWGADQEGGGPFVYPDPADDDRVIGFEVDLARLLAGELGVRDEFKQADWNTLPEFLRSGVIDIVLNGYEWTADRAAFMRATAPYYIYELQLLAREDDNTIRSWDDLKLSGGNRPQISVLSSSSSEAYLKQHFGDSVEIVGYQGNTDAMAQVRQGVHAATLEDWPIAVFYKNQPQGRRLRFIGEPVGRGYYVMYVAREEDRLADALSGAIDALYRDGRLKTLYEKWGIWNATQMQLPAATSELKALQIAGSASGAAAAPHGMGVVRRYWRILLSAAWMTVKLSIFSMPLAIALGLLIALGRLYGPQLLRPILTIYVEVLRGTPVMLQLYFIYFLLPMVLPMSVRPYFGPVIAAVLGLAINYSAYEAEIYRAGLQAIPKGQMEAALALGMTRRAALRHVIVPQAVRLVVPPVTNDFIALFKDTSICSVIAVTELSKQYNVLANSTGAIVELAAMTALLYLAMSYPLSLTARWMERRMETGA